MSAVLKYMKETNDKICILRGISHGHREPYWIKYLDPANSREFSETSLIYTASDGTQIQAFECETFIKREAVEPTGLPEYTHPDKICTGYNPLTASELIRDGIRIYND